MLISSAEAPLHPQLTSKILIIRGLEDEVRSAEWIQDRIQSYGKIVSIKVVTKKKAAKVTMSSKKAAIAVKCASNEIFYDYPDIVVKYGREVARERELESSLFSEIEASASRAKPDLREMTMPGTILIYHF